MASLSSSSSFASDGHEDNLDYRLEREHLKEDLAYGGLNDIIDSEEQEDIDENQMDNIQKQNLKEFQAVSKFNRVVVQNQNMQEQLKETAEEVQNTLQQQLQSLKIQKGKSTQNIKKQILLQQKKRREQAQMQSANIQDNVQGPQQSPINDQQAVQLKVSAPQLYDGAGDEPALELPEGEEVKDQNTVQNNEETTKQDALFTEQIENITLAQNVFDKTNINILDQSILDQPLNLSLDNHLKQIGSITRGKLNMFTTFIEPLKDESKAIAWGRVLAFEKKEELSNGFDPYNSQTQEACVMISGLKRELFCLPAQFIETVRYVEHEQWNVVFDQNGSYDKNTKIYTDKILSDSYDTQKCDVLVSALKQYISSTLQVNQQFIEIEPLWRIYQFNDPTVPREPHVWLRIRYPANYDVLQPAQFIKETNGVFTHLCGSTVRPLDLFLAQNQIKACNWLEYSGVDLHAYKQHLAALQKNNNKKIYNGTAMTTVFHEFSLNLQQKDAQISNSCLNIQPICLSVAYISIRKLQDSKSEDPLIITLTYNQRVSLQQALPYQQTNSQTFIFAKALNNKRAFKTQTLQLNQQQIGFEEAEKNGSVNVKIVALDKEVELYSAFFGVLGQLNPDVLVSNNLYEDFSNILRRAARALPWNVVQNEMLKWSTKLQHNQLYAALILNEKSDYRNLVRQMFSGRLLIELSKEIAEFTPDDKETTIEYTVQILCNQELSITPGFQLALLYDDSQRFKNELLPELLRESFAVMKICRELSIIPLTCKIAQLSFYQWNNVIGLGRAKRVENLLLHNFAVLPFVIPDYTPQDVESDDNKAKYAGGYVIDPVVGLHDTAIVVLDFNSLYPSVIREHNICFTTVPPTVSQDNYTQFIEESQKFKFSCQLPYIIGNLVTQRQQVKKVVKEKNAQIRGASEAERPRLEQDLQQLNIQQLALKLCANSMYGSLGYQKSRFYCPKVAAAIPFLGRNELQCAISASRSLGYQIVAGDTDSIMVDTRLQFGLQAIHGLENPPAQARNEVEAFSRRVAEIAARISAKVGEGKRYLELGLDYVFVKALFLAKKKYAALKVTPRQNVVLEAKGLDMVRRDWAAISRAFSAEILSILMWRPRSEAIDLVIGRCERLRDALAQRSRQITLQQFKMTKSLSKPLRAYIDQKQTDLPHVRVAQALLAQGRSVVQGQIIEYLVVSPSVVKGKFQRDVRCQADQCIPYGEFQRLFGITHPAAVLDMDFYVTNQILPPLARLCSFIPELTTYQLGSALGVEVNMAVESTQNARLQITSDIRDTYSVCAPFVYRCACGQTRTWPETQAEADMTVDLDNPSRAFRREVAKNDALLNFDDFLKIKCSKCGELPAAKQMIASLQQQLNYYRRVYFFTPMYCSNQKCPNYVPIKNILEIQKGSRNLNNELSGSSVLNQQNCLCGECQGEVQAIFPISQYRNQLQFFVDLFNPDHMFYKTERSRLLEGYDVFNKVFKFITGYLDNFEIMYVDLKAALQSIKW